MRISVQTVFRIAAVLAVLGSAVVAEAQTGACPTSTAQVANPNGWVCINPDSDYNTMDVGPTGTPVPRIVRMDLLLFGPAVADTSTGTPTQTINIGKPPMNAEASVWIQVSQLTTIPQGQVWKARAVMVGQPDSTGAIQVSARSPESNPFTRPFPPVPAPRAPMRVSVVGS